MEQTREPKSILKTVVQIVVGIVCVLVVAVFLFPCSGRGGIESAKSASDLSNIKWMAIAVMMYSEDNDNRLPLGHGVGDADGAHGYNYYKYVPADWSDDPNPTFRVDYSRTFVMNTLQDYVKNDQIMASPGQDELLYRDSEGVRPGKEKSPTTYAYNGYLHAYEKEAIVNLAQLPLFTEANGNRIAFGVGFANPALDCATPYEPCYYKPRTDAGCETGNGGTGAMYKKYDNSNSSYWLYKRGQNWAFNDTHAKFRRVGETMAPNHTDWRTDPWTGYDSDGHADTYWHNGCHAWLFRPDYGFEE